MPNGRWLNRNHLNRQRKAWHSPIPKPTHVSHCKKIDLEVTFSFSSNPPQNNNIMVFKILSLMLLLLQGTSAMNIKFNSVNCKEEAITLAFDRICTENNTCTIGTQANLVGSGKYYSHCWIDPSLDKHLARNSHFNVFAL